MNNELVHHGILGMKWGVRRTKSQLGYKTSDNKNIENYNKKTSDNKNIENYNKKTSDNKNIENYNKKTSDNKNIENYNKKTNNKTQKYNSVEKKSISDLSNDELRERISRLEMEKKYSDLIKASNPQKGKKFIVSVLEKSGQNIATQFTTYVLGRGVNKVFEGVFKDPAIVNPKKGQKDK